MIIKSRAFTNNGFIPTEHTGFGDDISPELTIINAPDETISFAIVLDDLDVPLRKSFNHWIVWNIPKTEVIPEGLSEINAIQGIAWGKNRYRGPKQPFFIKKEHRYVFTVYALDRMLNISEKSNKKALLSAMNGHILTDATLIGKYKRGM